LAVYYFITQFVSNLTFVSARATAAAETRQSFVGGPFSPAVCRCN